MLRVHDNKIAMAPIPDNVQKVLDVGTGTGLWVLDFADDHPGADVVGTDISPIQPTWVCPNARLYVMIAWTALFLAVRDGWTAPRPPPPPPPPGNSIN